MRQFNGNGLVTKIPIKNKAGQVVGHKDVVTYRGLLSRAHDEQLKAIETTVIQLPTKDNRLTAVFQAKVTTSKGTFTGVGDANPENVNSQIVPHLIRMAETRAKARALRDAVNIGVVCLEELGGEMEAEALCDNNGIEDPETQTHQLPDKGNGGDKDGKTVPVLSKPLAPGHGTSATRPAETAPVAPAPPAPKPPTNRGPEPLSENQRRYLFRLLAKQNLFGEEAKAWLCQALKVSTLKDASKAAASVLIDRLVQKDEEDHTMPDKGNGQDTTSFQEVTNARGA